MEIMLKHQTMKNGSTQLEVKCPGSICFSGARYKKKLK